MARFLSVGNVTLDIVNLLDKYPEEDSEVRALSQSVRMGGNAANTAIALAQLGHQVEWLGNLSDQPQVAVIEQTLQRYRVDFSHAKIQASSSLPTSYINLSQQNGSRTIVHHRDLLEYAADDFLDFALDAFDWVHFEGRGLDQLEVMMRRTRTVCGLPISLEIEKNRPGIEVLFELADVLFFSHDYAKAKGYDNAEPFLRALPEGMIATCTWGERGAWLRDSSGDIQHIAAIHLDKVVDTIGAGDVFNAAMLHGISTGEPLEALLPSAVRLAGEHCAREGFL